MLNYSRVARLSKEFGTGSGSCGHARTPADKKLNRGSWFLTPENRIDRNQTRDTQNGKFRWAEFDSAYTLVTQISRMDVDEAFDQFRTMVAARGSELHWSVSESGDREELLSVNDKPCLRLLWRADDRILTLEVSHGAEISPEWWWLDLINARLNDRQLHFDTEDFGFADAIDHGLDLCNLDRQ